MGHSAANALAFRTKQIRASLYEHWALSAMVGAHAPNFSDAVEGAKLLGGVQADKLSELLLLRDTANWARHAPPPGLDRLVAIPQGKVFAHDLELFRAELYQMPVFKESVFTGSAVRKFWNNFTLTGNDLSRYDFAAMSAFHPHLSDVDGGVKLPIHSSSDAVHASSKADVVKDSDFTMQSGVRTSIDAAVNSNLDAVVHSVIGAVNPECTIAVPPTGYDADDSPRMVKRKAFMRMMRLRQGISDERFAELELQKQAAAAAPPPPPQPQKTLEEVQRQVSDHLRRHYGPVPTTKVFVMPSLFD